MTILKNRSNQEDYDLHGDLAKIKSALQGASKGVRERASELLSEASDTLQEKASVAKVGAEDYISTNPFRSMGIAFATGAFIALLMRRKSMERYNEKR